MWEVTYEAPKGKRVNRYFWGVTAFDGLWFQESTKTWTKDPDSSSTYSTHDHSVKTTKAFIKYLDRHPELKGHDVFLVNNYKGSGGESLDLVAKWRQQ